ncbi:MAG: PAS domain S-box protein [Chloroflexi bacterium]|nr:PAS domain S-box protein [Chloroflexota bacterium]
MNERLDNKVFKSLLTQTSDGIIFADHEGLICLWNRGAEAIFGHTNKNAVGQSLDLIIPDSFRERHWAGFQRAMASGHTKYGQQLLPTRAIHKDGRTIYIEMTMTIVRDDFEQVAGALAVVRDITERRAQEQAIRKRLEELEQQTEVPV